MDEKTEELRDIFIEVTDEDTVTETQEETPGSLTSDEEVDARLEATIADMREQLDFSTTLSDADLVSVVRGFYAGDSDAEIARALGDASLSKTVNRARIDLHLLTDADRDAPFALETLREELDRGRTVEEIADRLDVSESTVRRYRRIVDAEAERRRVNDRYRGEFENVLQDREIAERLTANVQEDGLEDATEGMETDVSF